MCEATGPCCKCGRVTRHSYSYYTVEGRVSKKALPAGLAEEHRAFLCTRCVAAWPLLLVGLSAVGYIALAVLESLWLVTAALFLFVALHLLYIMLRDKAPPFWLSTTQAERRLIKHLQKQNPGEDKTYFRYSDFN